MLPPQTDRSSVPASEPGRRRALPQWLPGALIAGTPEDPAGGAVTYYVASSSLIDLQRALRMHSRWDGRLDSGPAISAALEAMLARIDEAGIVSVTRFASTPRSPEYWQVRVGGLRERGRRRLEFLLRSAAWAD